MDLMILILPLFAVLASACALSQVTDLNSGLGYTMADVNKVFRKKCRVYVAKGSFTDEDIPENAMEVLGLYDPENTPPGSFIPLGRLNEEMGKISWEQEKIPIDFGTIPGKTTITAEMKSIMCTPEMVDWVDGATAKGELSFLFVPDGDEGKTFLAISGVNIVTKGEMSLKGDLAVVTFEIEEKTDYLTTKLLFDQFEEES